MTISNICTVSTLKDKDKKLKQAVQGFKLVGLRKNLDGIASIAGISESTANKKKKDIESYWSEVSSTPDEDKIFIRDRSIETGIESIRKVLKGVPDSEKTKLGMEYVIGIILGTYLKVETDLLDKATSLIKVWTIGRYIANIYESVCAYKTNTDGVPIHSVNNPNAKYFLHARNMDTSSLDKLFTRTSNYIINEQCKRWSSSELLIKYVGISNQVLLNCIDKFLNIFSVSESSSHMLLKKGVISGTSQDTINNIYNSNTTESMSKGYYFKADFNYIYTMLRTKRSIIEHFEPSSLFSLLKQAVKVTEDEIHVPIRHRAKTSEHLGRTYNVFCSLRSEERKKLGYIGYDMSAAMQSISLQLINGTKADYPMLWEYANNPDYKRQIRNEIANTLSIPLEGVKSQLTAYANGSKKDVKLHTYYKQFQEESDKLRKAVLRWVSIYDNEVLVSAKTQSKKWKALQTETDWTDIDSRETWKEALGKSSVFFFVWTHYERDIRIAMLEHYFDDGIEVHDAVYSKVDIDPKLVKRAICDWTEFNIDISQEK